MPLQGPLAIASFVFDTTSIDHFSRIVQALPYPQSPAKVRIAWSQEEQSHERPTLMYAIQEIFGPAVTEETHACHDTIYITYPGKPSKALPSPNISVNTIGAFPGPPLVEVAWDTARRDRDIKCEDVLEHYRHLAATSHCRCSTLGVEQSILRMDGEFVFPVANACAVTCGTTFARDTDEHFKSTIEQIQNSIRTIAGLPCRIR